MFFPRGFRGKSYVVPDEAAQQEIARFIARFFLIVFGYCIFFGCAAIAVIVWLATKERLRQSIDFLGGCLFLYLLGWLLIFFWSVGASMCSQRICLAAISNSLGAR